MSEQKEHFENAQNIPASRLLPLPAQWIDDLTMHAKDAKTIRLLFGRSTRDTLTAPPELDDFQVRLTTLDRPDGQGTLDAFEIAEIPTPFLGPRQLAEFLWEEGQNHYRTKCLEADSDGSPRPRRLRFVVRLLDGSGAELADLGGYTGMAPESAKRRKASAVGLNFAEDNATEAPQSHGIARVNASLENGYLRLLKRVEAGLDKRADDINRMAELTYERANQYHAKVSKTDEEDDDGDMVLVAAMQMMTTVFGGRNERKEKAEDVKKRAPKDGKAGGPACAFAREALTHFTPDVIRTCQDTLGKQPVDRMLQTLRLANEPECEDRPLLIRFRESAEWFIKIFQNESEKHKLQCIPMGAASSLDALVKLSFAE